LNFQVYHRLFGRRLICHRGITGATRLEPST
jgi:hypothetical protein